MRNDVAGEREIGRWQAARKQLEIATADPGLRRHAHRMLWEICQVLHDPAASATYLRAALEENPFFTRPRECAGEAQRAVLVLAAPGDLQANLPLDRLFDDTTELHTLWITNAAATLADPHASVPPDLPRIDCVFIAIAEAAGHGEVLRAADALAGALGYPTINHGGRIGRLSRRGVAALLADLPHAVVPAHHVLDHGAASPIGYPIIIRPLGSHAGHGLARVASPEGLADYYACNTHVPRFTAAPFVDYRSHDGAWRKYRVIFVDGVPHPLHLAIHDDWAVWYYNAAMEGDPARLQEEARFLADLPASFPAPAMLALQELASRVGLDYFGLDCGVMRDGRLLVFEVETGMIVHRRSPQADAGCEPAAAICRAVEQMIVARCLSQSKK